MICPHCSHDNIDGIDACEDCGQPLADMQDPGSELERSITVHPVRALAPKKPMTVSAAASVGEAVKTMVQQRIGCLLVEEQGKITGIFTERDVLNRVQPDPDALQKPVSEFMTRSPEMISMTDSIAYAMHAMAVGGYRHLPIANAAGEPAGIISARDLLRFLSVRFANVRKNS